MRIYLFILIIYLFQFTSVIQCESDSDEKSLTEQVNKARPVKLEIVGDTSHLFAEEDFKKEEAISLGNNVETTDFHNHVSEKKDNYFENLTNFSLQDVVKNLTKYQTNNIKSTKCVYSNVTIPEAHNSVQILNGSALIKRMVDSTETDCYLVLFYVPWCPFSVRLAPMYNALPRAFTNFNVLAFDVSESVGYNTMFGTSAVPIIILFQQKNVLAKMNYTNKTLNDYISFVANLTNFPANYSITIEQQDLEGPVPTVAIKYFDYSLWFSWLFVLFVSLELVIRKTHLKNWIIDIYKRFFIDNRPRGLPHNPRQMIQNGAQNNENHPHND